MARFNVVLNVTFVSGPRAGVSAKKPLGHELGEAQGVASESEAYEWLDFVVVGGRFQVEKSAESYVVSSAVVSLVA